MFELSSSLILLYNHWCCGIALTCCIFFKSMTMSQRGMELLTDMVSVEAFPSRQAFKPRCKEEEDILESWSRLSLVEGDHSGWRLTAEGMVALDSTVACVDPQPASQLRMKPLHNYTDYELMLHLQQNGWVWKRYNAKRPLEAYKVGGPLVWATAGWSPRSVCKEYLLALVSLEALTVMYSAIDAVPHGCNRLTYVNLLKMGFAQIYVKNLNFLSYCRHKKKVFWVEILKGRAVYARHPVPKLYDLINKSFSYLYANCLQERCVCTATVPQALSIP